MKKKINTTVQRQVLADNIKCLLDSKSKTQTDMARDLNFPEATVSSWLNCERYPRIDRVQMMADYFGVYRSDITDEKRELSQVFTLSNYPYFPAAISAGLPIEVDGITRAKTISLPDEMMGRYAGHKDIAILRISGDSMDNLMPDNSLIAIKPVALDSITNNDVVVYSTNNEYGVKHFHRQDDTLIFKPNSTNPIHHDQIYNINDKITIHGKVIMHNVIHD